MELSKKAAAFSPDARGKGFFLVRDQHHQIEEGKWITFA
jgi:hypothetical protein